MSAFRRGFKTEAESLALELRREVKVGLHDRLDPCLLARHLEILVADLATLAGSGATAEAINHFTRIEPEAFSAGTIFRGTRALIIYNGAHARTRLANSIAHEVSHVVLGHEPSTAVSFGCRNWNEREESEASWLGGCLLVPRDAALRVAKAGTPLAEAADRFGISENLMRMRLHATGAMAQARRKDALRQRKI